MVSLRMSGPDGHGRMLGGRILSVVARRPGGTSGGVPFCLANRVAGILRAGIKAWSCWAWGAGLGSLSSDWLVGGGGGGGVAGRACACCWGCGSRRWRSRLLRRRLRSGRNGRSGLAHRLQLLQGLFVERGVAAIARCDSCQKAGPAWVGLTGRCASGGRFRKVMSFCLLASGLTTWTR